MTPIDRLAARAFALPAVPHAVEAAAARIMRDTRPRGMVVREIEGPRPLGARAMDALARLAAMPQPVERNADLVRALDLGDHSGLSNATNNLAMRGLLEIERRDRTRQCALLRVTAEGYAAVGGRA